MSHVDLRIFCCLHANVNSQYHTLIQESCFATLTMLCGPQSRGTVRLASSNPHTKPKIDHNYLSTPLDVALLAEGCRHIHNVVLNGAGTKDHVAGAWPKSRVHPNDTEEWRQYVRQQAGTCYHPSSTCKMGPDTDEEAVVDPRLRVRGVKGLRVAGEFEARIFFSEGSAKSEPFVLVDRYLGHAKAQ